MVGMQTLGVSSPEQKSDNMFQRLFWPTIENQYDVDLIGQQGFWICAVVGILSGVILIATGQWIFGPIVTFLYLAGGCGVRERDITASILVFLFYLIDHGAAYVITPGSRGNPLVMAVCLALLAANIRATVLSRRWKAGTLAEAELPERSVSTFADKLANRMPVFVWPKVKWVFYPLVGLAIVLTVAGLAMAPKPTVSSRPAAPVTVTLPVSPAR
jgi:hypothetical protein